MPAVRWSLTVAALMAATSCVWVVQSGSVARIDAEQATESDVLSPMKAFMADGSVAVFGNGARISRDSILGRGRRYSLGLTDTSSVTALPLDSVLGIEAFQGRVDGNRSAMISLGATALATVAVPALAVAIFGSCPTFYAIDAADEVPLAEGFSYSIVPMLEARDMDLVPVRADEGKVRLELRNEALETHYINHVELVAVEHAPGIDVVPDHRGLPVGLEADGRPPLSARDRSGRDVTTTLVSTDQSVFSSSAERIEEVRADDARDWIEMTFERPQSDSAVVALTLRNSLLTTVLLYDLMLGAAGAEAVDWLGTDMARIGTVVELGRWFGDAMGLRVQVRNGDEWVSVGRIPDSGPLAWHHVGVPIELPPEDPVSVRLDFTADGWRIDRVALAAVARISDPYRVPLGAVSGGDLPESEILSRLAAPDDDYLVTVPGASAVLEFPLPPAEPGVERSFLLSTQGYYTEWIRPAWIREAQVPSRFTPQESTVETLMARWTARKAEFEQTFYESRISGR